jgi:transcriptional regulator with XRE-family HTH domain
MSTFITNIFIDRLQSLLNRDLRPKGEFHKKVVKAGQITNWKKRGSAPQADKLFLIARYFNITSDYLIGLSDEPRPLSTKYKLPELDTLFIKSPTPKPYEINNHVLDEMKSQVSRIYKHRGPRDIDKMRLFLSTLDPGEVDKT